MTAERRIVEAARDHLLERGILDFSMRGLARNLGMTAPALYRYFPGKTELLVAVAERSFDLLDERLFRGLQGADADDRLARVASGYLHFALDHPRDFAVLSMLPGAFGTDQLPPEILRREEATFRFWVDRVREAMAAGVLQAAPPEEVAALMRSVAHGLVSLHLRGALATGDRASFESLFWASGIRMLEGIRGPGWSRERLPSTVRWTPGDDAGEGTDRVPGGRAPPRTP